MKRILLALMLLSGWNAIAADMPRVYIEANENR